MGDFVDYIPFIVGGGLFFGAVMAGLWKGRKNNESSENKEVISGVIQDNYSMLMMSEQLRSNRETMERLVHSMDSNTNEMHRLREYARDISKVLETRSKM